MAPLRSLALALLLLFASATLFAQTAGSISGTIHDSNGGALPGVTVEAKSPPLQGIAHRRQRRDRHLSPPLLPPGDYTVTFTLSGFATVARSDVHRSPSDKEATRRRRDADRA